jgi:site-specific recombinase XerD
MTVIRADAAPLKSALRLASRSGTTPGAHQEKASAAAGRGKRGAARTRLSPEDLRQLMLDEFAAWLDTRVSPKTKRHYQANTIDNYVGAGVTLGQWMTAQQIDDDFTACDAATLNQFFSGYFKAHTQGGTNTLQRNLAHLFEWLQHVHGYRNPYADQSLNRYAPAKSRPTTLSDDFIRELLDATGGGQARDFVEVRDHAIIRVFTEGPRLMEVAQMEIADLSPDMIAQPGATVVPLKSAREFYKGRYVPFSPSTGRAIVAYLRARNKRHGADGPALWLSTRGGEPLTGSGIYQMLKRRTRRLGYDPSTIWPHAMRHTFAHDWLDGGGSEGDLMRIMGWKDRQMVDRYAADMQDERAMDAKRRRGDMY